MQDLGLCPVADSCTFLNTFFAAGGYALRVLMNIALLIVTPPVCTIK